METTMACQALEKTKKGEDMFSDPKMSECQLTAPWNLLGSTVINHDTPVPEINLNLKGKPGKFGISEQLLRMTILGGDLGQKHSQLFWGLPSLHSESIVATLLVLPLNSCSLEPHLVLFNGVCRAVTAPVLDCGSPALPQCHPLPLTFIQPQTFPKTEPQPQTLPFTQAHPQVHMESLLSPTQSPSPPCGNTLETPQNGTVSGGLNGNEHLQFYVLQNHQDSLWGLVPECQQYGTPFGLLVPNIPLAGRPPQNYVSIPRTGHFHFGSELQNNLEPYGPNNPLPPWCYQPCGRTGVLEVMVPQFKPTGASPRSCKCAKPQRTVHWDQSCSDLRTREPSQSESFCEKVSMEPQLRKDVAKNLGRILGKCPLGSPQMISGCYVLNSVVPETEMEWACHSGIGLGSEQLSISRKSLDQRQTRSILRLHVSRKLWQITMGRIPIKVCCSWLAQDEPPWNSPLRNIYCNTAVPRIPFLDHKTQKMLEAHLIRYRVSQMWGLPVKVIESIKFYMLREAKTWPLPQFDFPSSSNGTSGIDLKSSFPHPLRENSDLFHEDKTETANSASIIDHLPLTISRAHGEDEGSLGKSHSGSGYEVTEKIQTAEGDRPSNDDNMSQNDPELQVRPGQEQPMKEQVAGSESQNETASSSSHREVTGGKQSVEKHPARVLITPGMLREILRAREVSALLSESSLSSKMGSSTKKNEAGSEPASTVATGHNPSRMSLAEDPTVLDFKKQLFKELKLKLENQSQSQTGGYESDVSFTSDSLTGYSQSSSNSVSSVDVSVFRDLHPHLYNRGMSSDPWQEPRAFRHNTRNLTPAEKRLASPVPRKENGRSETPRSETSKAGEERQPIKGKSDKKPHPPESYFRKKIGQFFQWLYSSKDNTRHRTEKDRALFMSCGPPEAHELMASLGRLLEDKLLCGQKSGFLEWSQKKRLHAQPEPTNGQPSSHGATYAQHGERKSNCYCPQPAIAPGPSRTLSPGQRHPHVSFEQQPQFWSYLPSPESRDP